MRTEPGRSRTPGRVAERSKAHAWRACGHLKCLVGSNPTPSVPDAPTPARTARKISLAEPRETPSFSEGWQNGNAPVSKTGALTGLRVRIPPPPLYLTTSYVAWRRAGSTRPSQSPWWGRRLSTPPGPVEPSLRRPPTVGTDDRVTRLAREHGPPIPIRRGSNPRD